MSRKRDRPVAASAAQQHGATSFFLSASADDPAWDCDQNITKALHYSSPNNKIASNIFAGAATVVSPFFNRTSVSTASANTPLISSATATASPPLSSVPEEPDYHFDLSQSSNASTLTFDCNNDASDSNCSMDMEISGEGSLGGMTSGGNTAMMMSVIDGVVDFSVGGRQSSVSVPMNNIQAEMKSPEINTCSYPPSKRSRLGSGPHTLSQSSGEYAISTGKVSNTMTCGTKNMITSLNCGKNMDKGDFSCHVCFLGAVHGKNSSFALTSSVDGSSVPADCHSLLTYFQPTKRKTPLISQQQQQQCQHHGLQSSSASTPLYLSHCRYCDKPTCLTCTRECEQCLNRFCTFCTKVDYEMSIVEKILCFECCDEHHGKSFVQKRHDNEHCYKMDI